MAAESVSDSVVEPLSSASKLFQSVSTGTIALSHTTDARQLWLVVWSIAVQLGSARPCCMCTQSSFASNGRCVSERCSLPLFCLLVMFHLALQSQDMPFRWIPLQQRLSICPRSPTLRLLLLATSFELPSFTAPVSCLPRPNAVAQVRSGVQQFSGSTVSVTHNSHAAWRSVFCVSFAFVLFCDAQAHSCNAAAQWCWNPLRRMRAGTRLEHVQSWVTPRAGCTL